MLTKILSAIFKEKTNTATRETVTYNAPGTYDPKYGKQTLYVTGKGVNGTAGSAYYNYLAGTANNNTVPPTQTFVSVTNQWKTTWYNYTYGLAYTTYNAVPSVGNGVYYNTDPGPGSSYGSVSMTYTYGYSAGINYNVWSYQLSGFYNATSYPVAGYNSPSYPYAGSNPSTTGASASGFGVTFPGGYGTTAPTIPNTSVVTTYGTPVSVTVPSGAYVTVSLRSNDSDPA